MAKDPAVLFYTSDFLTGTMLMTDEEIGQYIKLLCLQHQRGRLTKNHMLSICKTLDSEVLSKFTLDSDGMYYNLRMEEESIKRKSFTESRKHNGSKGGRPKKNKPSAKPYAKPSDNLTEDENENEIESVIKDETESVFINTEYMDFIEMFHSEEWFEQIAMSYKMSLDIITRLAEDFENDRRLDNSYTEKSNIELKNWFINLVKTKKNMAPKNETSEEKAERLIKMAKYKKNGN